MFFTTYKDSNGDPKECADLEALLPGDELVITGLLTLADMVKAECVEIVVPEE